MSFLWVAAGVGLGFSAFGLRSASQSFSNSADKVKSSKFVSGTLVTAKEGGLKAPESGSDCLAFRFRKFRLTEDVINSDDYGKRIRKNKELVEDVFREVSWGLKLEDGHVILPTCSSSMKQWEIDWQESVDVFKEPQGGGSKRTIGYRVREEIIPVGRYVWVAGAQKGGALEPNKIGAFIVTDKSPLNLAKQYEESAGKLQIASWIFMSGALICGITGIGGFVNTETD